jgi:hypothetical protein
MSETRKTAEEPGVLRRAYDEIKAGGDRLDAYGQEKGKVAREYYQQRWNELKQSRNRKRSGKSR